MKTRAATASLLLFITALTLLAAIFGPTWGAFAHNDQQSFAGSGSTPGVRR